jgi:hypothetical protein
MRTDVANLHNQLDQLDFVRGPKMIKRIMCNDYDDKWRRGGQSVLGDCSLSF